MEPMVKGRHMKTYLVTGHGSRKAGSLEECLMWAKKQINAGEGALFSLARQRAGEASAKIVLQIDCDGISEPRSDSFIGVGTAFTYE